MASISGTVTIAGDPDDWIAVAWDADTHAYAGVATVAGGAYTISGLTAGKAYVVGCRPKSGGVWLPAKQITINDYILPTELTAYFKATALSGDEYYSDVVLLMPFNDNDGVTSFEDIKNHIFTGSGNAQIDTDQYKFGGSSLLLDGNGDYLSSESSNDFGLAANDFTIEFWQRPLALTRNESILTIDDGTSSKVNLWNDQYNQIRAQVIVSGNQVCEPLRSGISTNTWAHCAIVRSNNVMTVYVGGSGGSGASIENNLGSSAVINIGLASSGAYSNFTGHIDDLRITKGIARYTENFTAPDVSFLDISPKTGETEPAWPDVGQTVIDNVVTWTNMGQFVRPLMHGPLIAA